MASLKDKWTKKDMIKALEKLPRGTDAFSSAYDRVVQRIDDQPERSKSLAHRTLRWITHAVRQMSVTEIRHALAIEPGERDLDENNLCDIEDVLSFCAGLVVVNEGTELVRFVHFTTQEYFKGRGARHLPEANKKIAMDCLTYIMFDEVGKGWCDDDSNDRLITDDYIDFHKDNGVNLVAEYEVKLRWRYMPKSLKHRIRRYPLAIYVFYNGGIHAKQVSDCSVAKRVVEFVKQDSKVVAAMQILSFLDRELRGISPFGVAMGGEMLGLHFATYFGIEKAVSLLLADGYAADVKDAGGRSSLSWASCKGHMEVVKLLLSRKDVDVNSRDDKYNTPLHIAAAQGYNGIVKQLLAHKDIEVNPNSTLYGTPLLVAAKNGHLAVIKLLASRKDIGINMKNKYRETALHLAARQGHNHVVQYLFQRDDVEVDSNSGYGVPWHAAVLSPCEEVAKTFLARIDAKADIRIDSKDYKGRTAFSSAAGNWFSNGAILELLLARIDSKGDIDVDSKDDEGRTPLSHAAGTGIANMVGHLLDPVHGKRNIDPNSKDIRGRTPLAWAALRGKDTVIKLFLKWHNTQGDIDVNSGDTDGNTPLSYAARAGYKARDRYLWNSRDLDEGRLKTARLLLADEDVDVNAKDNKGRSILEQVAARARLSEADGQQSPDEDQEIIDQLLSAIEAGSQLSEADGQQSPDEDQEIIDQLRSAIEARLQADARNIRT